MIEKMTRYDFILLSGSKEAFMDSLSELGVMDIQHSAKPVDVKSEAMLTRLEALNDEIKRIEKGTDSQLEELRQDLRQLEKESAAVIHWGEYDTEKLGAIGLPVRFWCVPEKKFDPSWAEAAVLQEVEREDGKVWFVTVGDADIPFTPLPSPARDIAEV